MTDKDMLEILITRAHMRPDRKQYLAALIRLNVFPGTPEACATLLRIAPATEWLALDTKSLGLWKRFFVKESEKAEVRL
jgi:hypothetical protein